MDFKYILISEDYIARLELGKIKSFFFLSSINPELPEFDETIKDYNFRVDSKEKLNDVYVIIGKTTGHSFRVKWLKYSSLLKELSSKYELKELRRFLNKHFNQKKEVLRYGLKNNVLVHILDIPKEEKGLKCNCICPNCKGNLIAKIGDVNQPHFCHENSECDVNKANQTALHIMAKAIVEKYKTIKMPPCYIEFSDTDIYKELTEEQLYRYKNKLESKKEIFSQQMIEFDSIVIEKQISSIVPDVLALKNGRRCLIEIAVTHFVDEKKIEKTKSLNFPMIEIDLSDISKDTWDFEMVKDLIINDIKHKKWLFNPKANSKVKEVDEYYRLKIKELEKEYRQKELWIEKQNQFAIEKERQRIEAPKNLELMLEPQNYEKKIVSLRDDSKTKEIYEKTCLFSRSKTPPFYLDVPIEGEFIFECDRRIWQTLLFEKFIFKRRRSSAIEFDYQWIFSWLKEQKDFQINWKYSYKCNVNGYEYFLIRTVINKYLCYLERLGFITYYFNGMFDDMGFAQVEKAVTIFPPNKEFADSLEKAIQNVDKNSRYAECEILEQLEE